MANVNVKPVQPVTMDMTKLADGMKMMFEGYSMIFSALAEQADAIKMMQSVSEEVSKAEQNEVAVDTENVDTAVATEVQSTSDSVQASLTVDDITKVIVMKIKQNRKNNDKIGSLLKTYGCSKVSELPEGKYEAFLSDLSQI